MKRHRSKHPRKRKKSLGLPPSTGSRNYPFEANVYCDESGNSGPNYLDSQPFYVLAGWVVPRHEIANASAAVERIRQSISPQSKELKSGAILRGERAKLSAVALFKELGALGCIPLFVVAEKRFCVAGKIVDTFLDPDFNATLNNAFSADAETKKELANSFYSRFPQSVLNQFAQAYREPTEVGLHEALTLVMDASHKYLNPELAAAFDGCRTQIDALAACEAYQGPVGTVSNTLNMPCLISFLMMVENLGRIGFARTQKLIHDKTHAYEDGYKKIFAMHQGLHRWFVRVPGSSETYSNIENIGAFEVVDSKGDLLIQAADTLAGVVNHLCTLAMTTKTPTAGDMQLSATILPALLLSNPRISWSVCSDHCYSRLGESFLRPLCGVSDEKAQELSRIRTISVDKPVLPPLNALIETEPRVTIDLPLYAIVGRRSKTLMRIKNDDEGGSGATLNCTTTFVFHRRIDAENLLSFWDPKELTEPQDILEFGPKNITHLAELLADATKYCEVIAIVPGTERVAWAHLPTFTEGLVNSLGRIRRLFLSGLDKLVVQHHTIGEKEIISMLCSDGKYGAMIGLDGHIYEGLTREDALKTLRMGEGLDD